MKKTFILLSALSLSVATTSVYAHDTGVPHDEPAGAMVQGSGMVETKLVPISGYGKVGVQASTTVGARPPQPQGAVMQKREPVKETKTSAAVNTQYSMSLGAPVITGSQDIDARLLVLHKDAIKEMEKIRDAYRAKVAEITGSTTIRVGVQAKEDNMLGTGMMRRVLSGSTTDEVGKIMADKGVQESFLAQIGLKADFLRAVAKVFLGNKTETEAQ